MRLRLTAFALASLPPEPQEVARGPGRPGAARDDDRRLVRAARRGAGAAAREPCADARGADLRRGHGRARQASARATACGCASTSTTSPSTSRS